MTYKVSAKVMLQISPGLCWLPFYFLLPLDIIWAEAKMKISDFLR